MINLARLGMKGFFKIESVHPETGKRTLLMDWSPNLLLTNGMKEMSQRNFLTSVQVGIDLDNEPDPSFTGMPGWVAGTSAIEGSPTYGASPSAPFYGYKQITWRFPIGSISVNTNINRVGAGWGTSNDSNLVSLAKIVDSGGGETTVTWKADEYLDVSYEFRYYPATGDSTGSVDFNSVTYAYVLRAMAATDLAAWANNIGTKIASFAGNDSDWLAYDGDIGATIEDSPAADVNTAESDNSNDYTIAPVGQQSISFGMNVGPGTNNVDGWSLTTGKLMRSLRVKTTAGWYQVQFDNGGNGVSKTELFTMGIQFTLTWGEATIP